MQPVDPRDFDQMIFSVDIQVPSGRGEEGSNQISITDKTYIIRKLTHQIIAAPTLQRTSVQEFQDGLYRIDWSLYQQVRFWQGSIPMADAAYGSIRHGIWIPFQSPIVLEGNKTLNVRVQNAVDRPEPFEVQVCFHGIEDRRSSR